MDNTEYVIHSEGLSKRYGKNFYAVQNVYLNIPKGEIIGLVGKNGAGKTTLLRILTGLIKPTSGSFSLFGETDPKKLYAELGKVTTMIEQPAIYTNMTAKDNLMTACILKGVKNPIETGYIKEHLEFVGLGDMYENKRKAGNFSLGMRQRLGIAMATVGDPEIMLLDEPTNGLDPEGILEIRNLLTKINREKGVTMIVSSHILSELSKFATSYLFMENGKLIEQISAEKLETSVTGDLTLETSDNQKAFAMIQNAGLTINENETHLHITGFQNSADVLNLLYANGITLKSIRQSENSLEDHYLKLMGENV